MERFLNGVSGQPALSLVREGHSHVIGTALSRQATLMEMIVKDIELNHKIVLQKLAQVKFDSFKSDKFTAT